jgi:hypothetical protein
VVTPLGGEAADPAPSAPPKTSGKAIASLSLAILGMLGIPLVASIVAIVLGRQARREIREEPERLKGQDLAMAGSVLGWAGAIIVLVVVLSLTLDDIFFA